jgi:hypothetical protein
MIEINKDIVYTLVLNKHMITEISVALTIEEINELHNKLTTFINNNYKELNSDNWTIV